MNSPSNSSSRPDASQAAWEFRCPHCQQTTNFRQTELGTKVACSRCGKSFQLPSLQALQTAPSGSPLPPSAPPPKHAPPAAMPPTGAPPEMKIPTLAPVPAPAAMETNVAPPVELPPVELPPVTLPVKAPPSSDSPPQTLPSPAASPKETPPRQPSNLLPPSSKRDEPNSRDSGPASEEGSPVVMEKAAEPQSGNEKALESDLLPPTAKPASTDPAPLEDGNDQAAGLLPPQVSPEESAAEDPRGEVEGIPRSKAETTNVFLPDGAGGVVSVRSDRVTLSDGEQTREIRKLDRRTENQVRSLRSMVIFGVCIGVLVMTLLGLQFLFGG